MPPRSHSSGRETEAYSGLTAYSLVVTLSGEQALPPEPHGLGRKVCFSQRLQEVAALAWRGWDSGVWEQGLPPAV